MITFKEYCKTIKEDWGKTSPIPKEVYTDADQGGIPKKATKKSQLGVRQYMNANNPNIDDFNEDLQPFRYGGEWFYPVAASYTKLSHSIDRKIEYSDWCKNFSEMLSYTWEDFYDEAKKYGYGNCDVFACCLNGAFHYFIPVSVMLAEFPISHGISRSSIDVREELELILREIFRKATGGVTESRASRKGFRRVNEMVSRTRKRTDYSPTSDDFTFGEPVFVSPGKSQQEIVFRGKPVGFLRTKDKNPFSPLEETYLLPDVDKGIEPPTSGTLPGKEGWIDFKYFQSYEEALKYACDNFDEIAHLFEVGDFD